MPAVWRPPADPTASTKPAPTHQMRFRPTQTLAAVPTAVGAARRYVRSELTKAKLAALVDDAELVASELVTNAITATGLMAPDSTWPELEGLPVIRIRLGFSSTSVLVEVWDHDAELPVQQQAAEYAEGGRGLLIVNQLCTRWSARQVANGGKVVWGELPMPAHTGLPRLLSGQLMLGELRGGECLTASIPCPAGSSGIRSGWRTLPRRLGLDLLDLLDPLDLPASALDQCDAVGPPHQAHETAFDRATLEEPDEGQGESREEYRAPRA
jgi:anti-sigma regulatory factor (Ser/Thr protein kinase)